MTTTLHVRVGWPCPPIALLDEATRVMGADPRKVARHAERQSCSNAIAGHPALLHVEWTVKGRTRSKWNGNDGPEAYVDLTIDGSQEQAYEIARAVAFWLDNDRYRYLGNWWWQDEGDGIWRLGRAE